MSEYQYYEFQKVDGRLTEKEQDELRACSSRGRITPISYTNEYDFGDFKGDEHTWMEKYFDGHLYFADWGTHILHLAIPAGILRLKMVSQYCSTEVAGSRENSGKLILTFFSHDESGDYFPEDECCLSEMLPIRDELIRGDLRSLYIGWLLGVQTGQVGPEEKEPPVPPKLGVLSRPQETMAEFLRLNRHLLGVAAKNSPAVTTARADRQKMSRWITSLPATEKDEILVRFMTGEEAKLRLELQSRFHQQHKQGNFGAKTPKRRTAGELLAAAEAHGPYRR